MTFTHIATNYPIADRRHKMYDTPTTWNDVERSVAEWAQWGWRNGEFTCMDDIPQWAWETAEGCAYVIYYNHQNDLWRYDNVQQYEEEACPQSNDVQSIIAECVYLAIRDACTEAAVAVMEDENESVVATIVTEQFRCVGGQYMTLPMLDLGYKPKKRA
jgi:hypothetical protein